MTEYLKNFKNINQTTEKKDKIFFFRDLFEEITSAMTTSLDNKVNKEIFNNKWGVNSKKKRSIMT